MKGPVGGAEIRANGAGQMGADGHIRWAGSMGAELMGGAWGRGPRNWGTHRGRFQLGADVELSGELAGRKYTQAHGDHTEA